MAILFATGCGDHPVVKLKNIIDRSASPHGEARRSIKERGNYRAQTFFESQDALELASAITQNDVAAIRTLAATGADVNARGKCGMTPLIWALFTESLPAFQELIALGADPDQKLNDNYREFFRISDAVVFGGDTVMRIALHNEYPAFFMTSFPFSDNPDDYSQFGTLLHSFPGPPSRNPVSVLNLMIASGIDVNAKNPSGHTACYLALENGQVDAVRVLIDAGADVDVGNGSQGKTVRSDIDATITSYLQSLPKFKQAVMKEDASIEMRQTYAYYNNKLKQLIEIRDGLAKRGNTAVSDNRRPKRSVDEASRSHSNQSGHASQTPNSAATREDVKPDHARRADDTYNSKPTGRPLTATSELRTLDLPDRSGVRVQRSQPIGNDLASHWPSTHSFKLWNAELFFDSSTAQSLAKSIQVNDLEAASRIVESGQSVNTTGKRGISLLFWAYVTDNLEGFRWLLEQGADPDQRLTDAMYAENTQFLWEGQTVIGLSIVEHSYDYSVAALQSSTDINQTFEIGFNSDMSLLHLAVWMPAPAEVSKVISVLVENGIDIDAETGGGWTAAYVAHIRDMPNVALQLLQLGASPDIPNGKEGTLREVIDEKVQRILRVDSEELTRRDQDTIEIHTFLKNLHEQAEADSE